MDLSFMDELSVDALVSMSQAGMEGGNALADILSGKVTPSGHLTDTWAYQYQDYPGSENFSHNNGNVIEEYYTEGIYVGYRYFDSFHVKPRYAFGYGLSYTTFSIEVKKVSVQKGKVQVELKIANTGNASGKEVVQLYAACPEGKLQKEAKRLVAFGKTGLLAPKKKERMTLTFSLNQLESFHAGKASYLLEKGVYELYVGTAADKIVLAAKLQLEEDVVTARVDNICPLLDALPLIQPDAVGEKTGQDDGLKKQAVTIKLHEKEIRKRKIKYSSIEKIHKDKYTALAEKLSLEQAAPLVCGRPSQGSEEIIGAAAVTVPGTAGETTPVLKKSFGIDSMVLADGPAGIRLLAHYEVNPEDGSIYTMNHYQSLENRIFGKEFLHPGAEGHYQYCSAIPVGTLLAQSFDLELMKEVGRMIGREMEEFGVTLWLAPGMNIHRNPLCGRNFEYYSEDPLVSGRMAAALTQGVQEIPGRGTCIKHFACNNQEENRRGVSSIVSERALREIYLKGFEIAVKESHPLSIMTSYNKVNGVHAANSYDLCTKAARDEWGFDGIIMTDWTTTNAGGGSSAAKCIEAGNDLVMPGKMTDIQEIIDAVKGEKDQNLDERYLRRCAAHMIKVIMQTTRK